MPGSTLLISEVLKLVNDATSRQARIDLLKMHNSKSLRSILKGTFDPKIEFALPKTRPPFRADDAPEGITPSSLFRETRKFNYLTKNNTAVKQTKKEEIFITMLDSVHEGEAEILLQMIEKKSKINGLTPRLVLEAIPGLFEMPPEKPKKPKTRKAKIVTEDQEENNEEGE